MKRILTMLATATLATTVAPLSLNVALLNNMASPQVKFTPILKSQQNYDFIRLSDTTAIISNYFEETFFFDSTKVKTVSKGLIDLDKVGIFTRLSDTTGIFIDRNNDDNISYFFDSTKVNTASKGFISLNKSIYKFIRLSDTTGIFADLRKKSETFQYYFFDSTTMKSTELNLGFYYDFVPLSDTIGIFRTENQDTYFFDSTKINGANKGLVKFSENFNQYISLSDTIALFINLKGNAFLFDNTKISDSSQGLTDLKQDISEIYRLSDTAAITRNLKTEEALYFDSTQISNSSHGFTRLNKLLNSFFPLGKTSGIILEVLMGLPWDDTFHTYYFDSTQINNSSHGLTLLKDQPIHHFYRLSDTIGLLDWPGSSIRVPFSYLHIFDSTKVDNILQGMTSITTYGDSFVRLSDTTGLFINGIVNSKKRTVTYFEYK